MRFRSLSNFVVASSFACAVTPLVGCTTAKHNGAPQPLPVASSAASPAPALASAAAPTSAHEAPKPELVTFPSSIGTLHGFLYRPAGDGPFPAIVFNHGSERLPGWKPGQAQFY